VQKRFRWASTDIFLLPSRLMGVVISVGNGFAKSDIRSVLLRGAGI